MGGFQLRARQGGRALTSDMIQRDDNPRNSEAPSDGGDGTYVDKPSRRKPTTKRASPKRQQSDGPQQAERAPANKKQPTEPASGTSEPALTMWGLLSDAWRFYVQENEEMDMELGSERERTAELSQKLQTRNQQLKTQDRELETSKQKVQELVSQNERQRARLQDQIAQLRNQQRHLSSANEEVTLLKGEIADAAIQADVQEESINKLLQNARFRTGQNVKVTDNIISQNWLGMSYSIRLVSGRLVTAIRTSPLHALEFPERTSGLIRIATCPQGNDERRSAMFQNWLWGKIVQDFLNLAVSPWKGELGKAFAGFHQNLNCKSPASFSSILEESFSLILRSHA